MPGGGGGSSTTQVVMPDFVENLARQNVQDVERITSQPYTGYSLPRLADFSPDQMAGFDLARQSVGAGQGDLASARGLFGQVGGYNPQNVTAGTIQSPGDVRARTMGGVDVGQYMNPFIQQAVDPVMREISRKAEADRSQMGAANALGGAFGSDQAAIMNAESARNENQARSDALAQGLYSGYDRATGLAQTDSDRLLQAAIQNQGMRYNVNAGNVGNALQAALANQQAGLTANQQRLAAASGMAGLAPLGQQMAQSDVATMLGIGGAQQQMGQQSLDLAYNDFLRQQMNPMNMINLRTAVLSGQPYSVQYDQPQSGGGKGSTLGGLGGLASGGAAAYTAFCWLAREVYGPASVKWLAFRRWVLEDAPEWFRDLYIEHGREWAAWLREHPEERGRIRGMMDQAIAA